MYYDAPQQLTRCNMLLIDNFTAVVGTVNWTEVSIFKNNELMLWIESKSVCEILEARFKEIKALGKGPN